MAENNNSALLVMTTGIVANYVANNRLSPDELPGFVATVHGSLKRLGESQNKDPTSEATKRLTPGAIRRLITPQGITSLIDGRHFKSLRRHVSAAGYTPETYRERFGLPADFPMVHPEYSAQRSALAKSMGLGGRIVKGPSKQARKPNPTDN